MRLDWRFLEPVRRRLPTRELFRGLFRRELRVRYRGSSLGSHGRSSTRSGSWSRTGCSSRSCSRRSSIENYPLFVISGLISWTFFQSAVQMSSTSLLGQANLVKQVRFRAS